TAAYLYKHVARSRESCLVTFDRSARCVAPSRLIRTAIDGGISNAEGAGGRGAGAMRGGASLTAGAGGGSGRRSSTRGGGAIRSSALGGSGRASGLGSTRGGSAFGASCCTRRGSSAGVLSSPPG